MMVKEIKPAPERTATTCKGCGRAVWTTDINNNKMCVVCEPAKVDK